MWSSKGPQAKEPRTAAATLRPRPHGYVFESLRFHFTENGMEALRPHDRFQIALPIHTKTIQAFLCRPSLIFSNESALGLRSHDQSFPKICVFNYSTRPHETDSVVFSNLSTLESDFKSLRFQLFDPSTRHRYCCVFKSFHSGERFRKFAFSSKVCVFVWTGHENATKCLRFQMKTHPCGPG